MMKKITYTIYVLLLTFTLSAQYALDGSERWTHQDAFSDFLGNKDTYNYLYFLAGDTVILNKTYHKLYNNRHRVSTNASGVITHEDTVYNNYSGAMRYAQDTLFFVEKSSQTGKENLLYKFNLMVGDTVRNTSGSIAFICNSIDTVPFGNAFRRRYVMSQFTKIIEGIGNARSGLFPFFAIEGSRTAYCFESNDGIFYFNNPVDCFSFLQPLPSGTYDIADKISAAIVPNPSSGNFDIRVSDGVESTLTRVSVFNQQGKILFVLKGPFSGPAIPINPGKITPGAYLVFMETTKGNIVRKLVII